MVNYDQNSFVAGIAVGRQLKGWSTAGQRAQRDALASVTLEGVPVIQVSTVAVPGVFSGEISVLGILHFGELVEIDVSAAVAAGGLSDVITARATLAGVNEYGIAAAGLPGSISGNITAEVTLEVEE